MYCQYMYIYVLLFIFIDMLEPMDQLRNPYSSGPSIPPPLLAGRDEILDHAKLLLGRLKLGQSEKGLLLSGLRGSGKSALMRALAVLAQAEGCRAVMLRTAPDQPMAPALQAALEQGAQAGLVLVDDAQSLRAGDLALLVRTQEQLLQDQARLSLVLAGLPFQEQLDDASHALAARVFAAFDLDALSAADAAKALQAPAEAAGSGFDPEALRDIIRLSKGYPAFLQAWAYESWRTAKGPLITRADVRASAAAVTQRLDRDLYSPGFERLSPREKSYLRSMAHLGPGPHRSGDIADSMDAKITSLGPLRAKLMQGGWVYSPGHGRLGFTTPGFDEFMRRVMPNFR